jgi:protein-tyrosine kinase
MEKLQAALERAREKRESDGNVENRASTRRAPSAEPVESQVAQRWNALRPLQVDKVKLQRRKLVSLDAGRFATPYDMLRTKMLQIANSNGWKRIAITSPSPGCGKTTTCCNLAASLGRQEDLRVVLMDMDMRRPAMANTLMQKGTRSTSDIFERRVDFSEQVGRIGNNLAVSMNYIPMRDPSDIFLRQRTGEIVDEIEFDYKPDIMLFDMPPMLVNDDTSAFMKNVDAALIIVEAGLSTIEQVDMCEKELSVQTNVLGMVLNKCRFQSDGYGYYSSYGGRY